MVFVVFYTIYQKQNKKTFLWNFTLTPPTKTHIASMKKIKKSKQNMIERETK